MHEPPGGDVAENYQFRSSWAVVGPEFAFLANSQVRLVLLAMDHSGCGECPGPVFSGLSSISILKHRLVVPPLECVIQSGVGPDDLRFFISFQRMLVRLVLGHPFEQ